jgi:hypothetical protein
MKTQVSSLRHATLVEFIKKEGLRIEDFKVLHLENIRRLVNVVLSASLLILNGQLFFPDKAWRILLRLGGKMGLKSEKDGPYLLLRGLPLINPLYARSLPAWPPSLCSNRKAFSIASQNSLMPSDHL